MNKGLEVIEAHELFDVDYDHDRGRRPPPVDRALDGRVLRRGRRSPSSRCPTCASRSATPSAIRTGSPSRSAPSTGARLGSLDFEPPDLETFPCPRPRLRGRPGRRRRPGLAERRQRGRGGGVPRRAHPVAGHRRGRRRHPRGATTGTFETLADVLDADRAARERARRVVARIEETPVQHQLGSRSPAA